MTEAEWLALDGVPRCFSDAHRLVTFNRRTATLFGVACVRATPGLDGERRLLNAAREAEEAAEAGEWGQVGRIHRAAEAACGKVKIGPVAHHRALAAAALTRGEISRYWPDVVEWLYRSVSVSTKRSTRDLRRAYADILRDIFGNPFRPVAFDPVWRTDTVLTLASQMHDSRDFGAMPILADALQDAGCDNSDILDHCRDAKQVHVRGCWVVDLVLGK